MPGWPPGAPLPAAPGPAPGAPSTPSLPPSAGTPPSAFDTPVVPTTITAALAWACRKPRISRMPGVYIVYCAPDERCYIGSTACLRTRYSTHWSKLRRANHENGRLQAAWARHGANAVRFGVLEELPGAGDDDAEPQRLARENYWLTRILRADLYNLVVHAVASLRTTPTPRRKRTP